jgi:hypothetical protein
LAERDAAWSETAGSPQVEHIWNQLRIALTGDTPATAKLIAVTVAINSLLDLRRRGAAIRYERSFPTPAAGPGMAFDARRFILALAGRGIRLSAEGGQVVAFPSGMLDQVGLDTIRRHRADILSALAEREVIA